MKKEASPPPLWLWSKTSTTSREEEWDNLLAGYPPATVAFLTTPGSQSLRIRIYASHQETSRLQKQFGGKITRIETKSWEAGLKETRHPFSVRGMFRVFGEESEWQTYRSTFPLKPALWIPANMAFGTGSHPTTAGCLRLLADTSKKLQQTKWACADLGAGSGILALAARLLGATRVEAMDYDPVCIREIRKNARNNHLALAKIETGNVHDWLPSAPCHVITANLFSETLISASRNITESLLPGGTLIFSGVLHDQFAGVAQVFQSLGLIVQNHSKNKRWTIGSAEKPL